MKSSGDTFQPKTALLIWLAMGGKLQRLCGGSTGPKWLQGHDSWPSNPVTEPSADSEVEAKIIKEVLCVAQVDEKTDSFHELLEKQDLQSIPRISAWILSKRTKTKWSVDNHRSKRNEELVD